MAFILTTENGRVDTAAVMRAAHARAKRDRAAEPSLSYAQWLASALSYYWQCAQQQVAGWLIRHGQMQVLVVMDEHYARSVSTDGRLHR